MDSQGNTLEFLLSPTRDAEAAKRFLLKALGACVDLVPHTEKIEEKMAQYPIRSTHQARKQAPRVIKVDKNAAYPKAIAELKAGGVLPTSVDLAPASNTRIT